MFSTSPDKITDLLSDLGYTPDRRENWKLPSILVGNFMRGQQDEIKDGPIDHDQAQIFATKFCKATHREGRNAKGESFAEKLWPDFNGEDGAVVWPADSQMIINRMARIIIRKSIGRLNNMKSRLKRQAKESQAKVKDDEEDPFDFEGRQRSTTLQTERPLPLENSNNSVEVPCNEEINDIHTRTYHENDSQEVLDSSDEEIDENWKETLYTGGVGEPPSTPVPPKRKRTLFSAQVSEPDSSNPQHKKHKISEHGLHLGRGKPGRGKSLTRPKRGYYSRTSSTEMIDSGLGPATVGFPPAASVPPYTSRHGLPGDDFEFDDLFRLRTDDKKPSTTHQHAAPIDENVEPAMIYDEDEPWPLHSSRGSSTAPVAGRQDLERSQSLAHTPLATSFNVESVPPTISQRSPNVQLCVLKYHNGIPGVSEPIPIAKLKTFGLDFWQCKVSEFFEWYHRFSGMPLSTLERVVFVFGEGVKRRNWTIEAGDSDSSVDTLRNRIRETSAAAQQEMHTEFFEVQVTPPGWERILLNFASPLGSELGVGSGRGRSL